MVTANAGTYLPEIDDKRKFGLDISSYQGNVNFDKMANPEGFPEIKFVACRTGISWAYKDSWFESYWKTIKELMPSVKRMAYHVLYPAQPIKEQVDNMASRFPDRKFDGDAVVNDLELQHNVSRQKLSEACYEFTNRLQDWAKKPVIIYSRFSFIEAYMDYVSSKYVSWFEKQLWWMAQYYGKNWLGIPILKEFPTGSMYIPPALKFLNVIIHQNGDKGDGYKVGTASKQVDTNRFTQPDSKFWEIFGSQEIPTDPTQPEPLPPELPLDQKVEKLWNHHPELW